MIEIIFAIIFGFGIASTLCGLISDHSRADRTLIRALIFLIILSILTAVFTGGSMSIRGHLMNLVLGSVLVHTLWFIGGAVLSICAQLFVEGHLQELWIRFHPQSTPTPEVRMGQRAQIAGFRKAQTPSTLVGTSTQYLTESLDLRTETLIRLSYCVFENRSALTMSRLESALRLGTGARQKAFHKIVAGQRGRPKTKRIVHRYWRSVNGSSRVVQSLFADLCKLARDTGNRDQLTVQRLTDVGTSLGLSVEEMGRAIRGRV